MPDDDATPAATAATAAAAPQPSPDVPFEIGLVMAGAISAGAYTAGVIDFLIEALDEWELARNDPAQQNVCPPHKVRIKVMAGASAGGMTAGLAAGLLGMDFESVVAQPMNGQMATPSNNNLYRSWVNTIDADPLLGTKDLDLHPTVPLQSVLDSSILQDIADNAFAFERNDARVARPYVADPLHVLLTVTNLRGVPYAPTFSNWAKSQQYEMMMHADNMHFVVSARPPEDKGALWLEPYDFGNPDTWGVLQKTSLATGAFPVGLAPRLLKRSPSQYQARQWAHRGPHEVGGVHYCEYWEAIPPFWPAIDVQGTTDPKFMYEFLCVDGGVMNNEPLDLARIILAGPSGSNPRDGDKATRAVVMVMPFPNTDPYPVKYDGGTTLFRLVATMFNSLVDQARFKPQELALANDPNVYSRFLVVPRRGFRADGQPEPFTIACGSLNGFGGFLSRQFREHDYQLGRRNCQWFLKHYFVLPSEGENRNKLFDAWTDEARAKFRVLRVGRGKEGGGGSDPSAAPEEPPLLPIIPLMGKAAPDVPAPVWPRFTEAEFRALRPKVKNRLDRVVHALLDQNIEAWFWGPLARAALSSAWWFQGGTVVDNVMTMIRDDLAKRGLMR